MAEVALWQYRWTNPGNDTTVTPEMLAWKEVTPWNPRMQTLEQRIEELRSFRYNGKPAYEVRALGVIPDGVLAPEKCQAPGGRCDQEHHCCDLNRCAYGVAPVEAPSTKGGE